MAGYATKTGNAVFLHIRREKREIKSDGSAAIDGPEKKITRLAIGVEGGYDPEAGKQKYEYEDFYSIVVCSAILEIIPYPNADLPQSVIECVKAVLAADSATAKMESEAMAGTWDGEARVISKYATDLKQLDNGKKIPPSGWKCEECDLTSNLWLNLTDGSILCGRRFFDGSGGNDHAVSSQKTIFGQVSHDFSNVFRLNTTKNVVTLWRLSWAQSLPMARGMSTVT